ncbi:MAG: AI-2E family transporter [Clostridium sp.]|nr:AI-2E family transporter [Clostridium sp.]
MEQALPPRRPFTFDRVVRIIISALFTVGALWLVNTLSSVLLPFLVAWLIAYILEPFVQRNRALLHLKGRLIAIMLTLFEVILSALILLVIFMPTVIDETQQLASLIRDYASKGASIAFIPEEVHAFLREYIDFDLISQQMTGQDWRSAFDMLKAFISSGVDIIMGIVNWFLVILYVIFIMLDYERLLRGFKLMVPPRYRREVYSIGNDIKDSMNHYFRGQSLVAFCVGILFSIGFLIVGLPLAVVLGLFIGLLNMVPYLQLISIPITTLLCLVYSMRDGVEFWPIWWASMAVYIVVQCIQDLFLTPKIMGKAMGLNPAIILLSLSVWGVLLGFIGLIIALPLTTLLLAYYNRYIIHRHDGESMSQKRAEEHILKEIEEE